MGATFRAGAKNQTLPPRLPACMGATLGNRLDQADPGPQAAGCQDWQAEDAPGRPIRSSAEADTPASGRS